MDKTVIGCDLLGVVGRRTGSPVAMAQLLLRDGRLDTQVPLCAMDAQDRHRAQLRGLDARAAHREPQFLPFNQDFRTRQLPSGPWRAHQGKLH
jgi:hypothetical protein